MRRLALALAVLALAFSTSAAAMAAIEFIKLEDSTARRKALEPIIHSFLQRGYKKVPDWAELAFEVRRVILDKGYTYQSLDAVAEEAAKAKGMQR